MPATPEIRPNKCRIPGRASIRTGHSVPLSSGQHAGYTRRILGLNRRQQQLAANSARGAASFAAGTVVVRVARPATAVRAAPAGGRFSVTVKMDLKIAAATAAIG